MYYLIIDRFKSHFKPDPENQDHLPNDLIIRPRKDGPLCAFSSEIDKNAPSNADEAMIGVYSREQLQ